MEHNLAILADRLGISRWFYDSGVAKRAYEVDEKTIGFFCRAFGYTADTAEEAAKSLERYEAKYWKKPVEAIIVWRRGESFELRLNENQRDLPLKLVAENDAETYELAFEQTETERSAMVGRHTYRVYDIRLKTELPYGYYDFTIVCGKDVFRTRLAVVPDTCYTTTDLESGRLWGYSLQLYSLRSRRNWGVGDFTDLKDFVRLCASVGADVIGLNPLNVLFHDFPENASPYSSIDRLFLNPIYIDPAEVPMFEPSEWVAERQEIENFKKDKLIDYTNIYNVKLKVLRKLFLKPWAVAYQRAFEKFEVEKGADLERLAVYQALYSRQSATVWGGWRAWPKNLQNPNSAAVERFRQTHAQEIRFFKFLQFEADRQLGTVAQEVKACGLKIGLYRDLPVGVCKDSAELWADRYVFMDQAGAGAPPDAFFPCGQKWCLGAFHPAELKERAYEPYLKILRANMAYAGALRIDHVMGLMRLFMIPDEGKDGTYILYNSADMFGLLCLESYLHKCIVVGESIGNVPDGFLDMLRRNRIGAISVLWSERWNGNGAFKNPEDYPTNAFVSVGTHDMPPLKMWWFGYEIELMNRLKMLTDDEKIRAYHQREADRKMLLDALDYNGVWPEDRKRKSNYPYGEGYPEGIEEAAHSLLARSAGQVVMLQPEDIFQAVELQNLPGTDREQYPNWRHRLTVDLEDMPKNEAFMRHADLMNKYRRKKQKTG